MKLASAGIVEETVDREKLWAIQTPQAFTFDRLQKASNKAEVRRFPRYG